MILYFANREMQILGQASTTLLKGFTILDDLKSEDVDTGVATFECTIGFDKENRLKLEEMTNAGNYLLRSDDDENEFYTIIDSEIDTKNQEVYIYAEDAGLDLLNEVVGAFEATESHPAEWYINKYTNDSGFEIGINEIPATSTRKLSWDGEATVTERLASIATQFGGYEISFSFDIKGMEVSNKYINIYKERGKELEEPLMLNRDIDRIITKKSVANLATAFLCTGGIPKGKDKPITLEGYEYDDGDFYVSGKYVKSREAVKKWSRYVWNKEPNQQTGYAGHIVRQYSYDTTSQKTLCSHAITELKKICDMEVNYEIDIKKLPDTVRIGDRVNIVDDAGELYLSARILKFEKSAVNKSYKATLGEYLIKDSGISQKVEDLAAQFAELAASRTFYTWIAYADDETGAGISLDPAGKEYMGTAVNQTSEEVDISDPSIFKWSKIKGDPGEQGPPGDPGQEGPQGPPGDPGTSGKGIESESKEYYLSTSSEEVVGGTWQSDIPEWQSGKYIWSRNVITWTDGTISYTEPVLESTLNHVNETADYASAQATEAKNTAQTANEAAASAQNAANEAINKAEIAQASAAESQAAVSAAQSEITAINTEVTLLKNDTAAIRSEVSGQIETINETLSADYSKKTEVSTIEANLKAEISKSAAEIQTTLSEDYAAKSELAELQGSLQTQITQNAEGISINASKVEKLETDTAEAQTQINAAQTAAQSAQKSADEAKTAASKAQSDATTANNAAAAADAKAQSAQKAADDAQTDLNNAKATLEEVTNRVGATEGEITAAQAAVDKAQKAADDAQAAADTAKTNAATAQSAASAAQTKADSAAQAAASAQAAADKAQSDLDKLTSRVTKAETSITNNAEAIKLAATKEEVATTLAGYSTTTEMNAVIEQKANSITSEVSSTYATKTENQAALDAANAAQDEVNEISDKTRSGYIETLSGSGFVQSSKAEDGGTAEVVVYGKSVQDGTPTPDAPVEIQSVENPKVKACGKNLVDIKEALDYWGCTYTEENGVYTITGFGNAYGNPFIFTNTAAIHTLSAIQTSTNVVNGRISFAYVDESGNITRNAELYTDGTSITSWANVNAIYLNHSSTSGGWSRTIENLQVELGNTATDYEPYTANTATLSDIVLRSAGEAKDRVFKDSDGVWKVERKVYEEIFDGSETWHTWGVNAYTEGNTGFFCYFRSAGKIEPTIARVITNILPFNSDAWGGRTVGICVNDSRNPYISVAFSNEWLDDVSTNNNAVLSFKSFLAETNLKVIGVRYNPIIETLPDSTQAELNALTTYNPVTNVIASDGVTPDIDVSFWTRDYRTKNTAEVAKTTAEQTADKFTWLVESGTSSSNFTLTDRVASLLSSEFQIDALTTFKNSSMDGTSTVINGGAIKANTISADKLNVTDLSALGATIGGFTIGDTAIYNGTDSLAGADNSVYLGLDGISCGTKFSVDKAGMLTANDASITGNTNITGNLITNGNVLICSENMKEDPLAGYIEFLTSSISIHGGETLSLRATRGVNVSGELTVENTAVSLDGHKHGSLYHASSGNLCLICVVDSDTYYVRKGEAMTNINVCSGSGTYPWYNVYTENLKVSAGKPVFTYIGSSGSGSTVSYATNMYVGSTGTVSRTTNTSSKMIKHDIAELKGDAIKAENLYDVNVYQAKYNEDILSDDDPRYLKDLPMFIIEDLDQSYPVAVDKPTGNAKEWSWNAQYIIPPMLKLIQEQHKVDIVHEERFNQTELRISALQNQLNEAMITIAKQQKQIDLLMAS